MSNALRSIVPRLSRSAKTCGLTPTTAARLIIPSSSATTSSSTTSIPSIHSRNFHSSIRNYGSGSNDSTLSSLLNKELSYEKESMQANPSEPEFLKNFKDSGIWKILDTKGSDEVKLTRQFGNEEIRILFSISDVDSANPTAGLQEQDPEDPEGLNDNEMDQEGNEEDPDFNFRCAITISKPSGGALTIDAQAEEGSFVIDNISYYKDANLAGDISAEADWARRGMYIGPQFETLDSEVQNQFTEYLEERGIDTDLACFIPSYAEWKEQREYVSWLGQVKDFIDA